MLPFLSGILQAILPSLASNEIETKSKKRLVIISVDLARIVCAVGRPVHVAMLPFLSGILQAILPSLASNEI